MYVGRMFPNKIITKGATWLVGGHIREQPYVLLRKSSAPFLIISSVNNNVSRKAVGFRFYI